MNCPLCRTELRPTDRQGVEIDYCPQCRGVWLDRGELDKIIERSGEYDRGSKGKREYDDDDKRREGRGDYEQPQPNYIPAPHPNQPYPSQQQYPPQQPYPSQHNPHYDDRHRDDDRYRKRKKGGFLGELFDFS